MSTRGLRLRNLLILTAVWLALLVCWEGAWRVVGWRPWVFPAPSHVLDASMAMLDIHTYFGEPLHKGWPFEPAPDSGLVSSMGETESIFESPLAQAIPITGVRLLIGFGLSLALGITLGLLIWRFEPLNAMLGPLFLGVQTLPSVCWVPLGVLLFGINERGILFVTVMGSFCAVAIALRDGLMTVPPAYRIAGLMLGARRVNLYRFILLPAGMPALAGALRQGFSFAWRSLMGAELVLLVQRHGLGFLLHVGREFADVAQVVAVMIMMILVGMAADRWIFAVIEKRIRRRFGLITS